jgi:hypothetical protein
MFNEVMAENVPKPQEKVDKWAVKGENHIIRTDTLDNLWAETRPKNERI